MTTHKLVVATPATSESTEGLAETCEVRSDETACRDAAAYCDAESSASPQAYVDDVPASLHEQLEALVQILASGNQSVSEAEEGSLTEYYDSARSFEPTDYAQFAAGHPDECHTSTKVAPDPDFEDRKLLNARAYGFAAGLGMSIIVGGAMVMALGMGEPPAAAANHPAIEQVQASADTGASPELQNAMVPKLVAPDSVEQLSVAAGEDRGTARIGGSSIENGSGASTAPVEPNINNKIAEAAAVGGSEADSRRHGLAPAENSLVMGEAAHFETTVTAANQGEQRSQSPNAELNHGEAEVKSGNGQIRTARVVEHVNMRAGPNSRETVLAIVSEGSPVEVVQCTHWCEVIFAGRRGWIYKDFIDAAGADESTAHYN